MSTRKFPSQFTQKVTPVSADKLFIADSADSNIIKYITFADVQGPQGVGITWRGAYSGATAYSVNDAVSYTNGIAYICILASTGNVPTNTTYWSPMADSIVATESSKGTVRLATTTDVTNGTDTESSEPLVVQPSQLKTTNDNLNAEKLKIKSKEDVVAATTANITLSGAQTIDGVSVTAGQRVLVKDQSTASQNGIYVCASGSWTRATDFDSNINNEVDLGAQVWVQSGTVNAGRCYVLSTSGTITVGTTSLTFTQIFPQVLADVSARATQSTGTTLTSGSWTSVAFDTEEYDTSSIHSTVTNNSRLTIPSGQAGKYMIVGNIGDNSSGNLRGIRILKNGTTSLAAIYNYNVVSGTQDNLNVCTIANLAVSDYVELQGYANTASGTTVTAETDFIIQKIA